MISRNAFIKIMDGLRDYHDGLTVLEKNLRADFFFCPNYLSNILDCVLEALCEDLELKSDPYFEDEYIYDFPYGFDWGRSKQAKKIIRLRNGEQYTLESSGQLYDFLTRNKE